MPEINEYILKIFENNIQKAVISKPVNKSCEYKKITITKMSNSYQVAKYTEKQVFHENITAEKVAERCIELIDNTYLQFNAWSESKEFSIMITKKGKVFYKAKNTTNQPSVVPAEHNRQKQYILKEGTVIDTLLNTNDIRSSIGGISYLTHEKINRIDLTKEAFTMAMTSFINENLWKD